MTKAIRWGLLASGLVSCAAWAQTVSPSVAPYTLEVKRVAPGFSKKESDELLKELPRALRSAGITIPLSAMTEAALVALKRQDCDRDDGCLQQLAQKAESLYAIYAAVDYTLDKNVVASGRVVRDDGELVRRLQVVTMPKGAKAFGVVAKEALVKLVEELELNKLPTSRPVIGPPPLVVSDTPLVVGPKRDPVLTPAPTVEKSGGISKTAAYVILGGGLAAIIGGGAIVLTAPQVTTDGENVYEPQKDLVASTNTQRAIGWSVLGVGAAAVAAGAILWGMSPESSTQVSAIPLPGGGVVSVKGAFR